MEVIVDVLVVLGAVVGSLLVLVLVAPISVSARGEIDAEAFHASYIARVRWALGLVGLDLASGARPTLRVLGVPVARISERREGSSPRRQKDKGKDAKAQDDTPSGPGLVWLFRQRRELWRLVLRLVSTLHLRGRVSGAVGMPEPDDTVWLALALNQLDQRLPAGTLDVDVDYSDAVMDLEGRLTSWAVPAHVIAVGLALYFFSDLGRALRGRVRPTTSATRSPGLGAPASSHGDKP